MSLTGLGFTTIDKMSSALTDDTVTPQQRLEIINVLNFCQQENLSPDSQEWLFICLDSGVQRVISDGKLKLVDVPLLSSKPKENPKSESNTVDLTDDMRSLLS